MVQVRYVNRLGVRQDLVLILDDGREIPAVQDLGTGRLFVRDGHGRRHVIAWRWRQDRQWLVLDGREDRKFDNLAEAIGYLESLGGEPVPRGRVAVIGQVGGELLYGNVPAGAGR